MNGVEERGGLRLEALSDGVFAIALTLLVLDLRTPPHRPGRLLHALALQWPAFVSFVASFLYIGVIWTNHRATFRHVAAAGRDITWVNFGILSGAVLLPFQTAVLADAFRSGNRVDERTAAFLYAGLAQLLLVAWFALFFLLHSRRYPTASDGSLASWRAQMRRPLVGSCGYVLSAGLSLIDPAISLVVFVLIPIYYVLTSEGLQRARAG